MLEAASRSQVNCRKLHPHSAADSLMAPRDAVRPSNLKWELPIAAAAGLLIVSVDSHVNNRIHSPSFVQDASPRIKRGVWELS